MSDFVCITKKLCMVFFTPYPYVLCCSYDRMSNFGSTGVALGLMYTQVMFWGSNGIMFFIWITKNNSFLYYFRFILFFYTIYVYYVCISKTIYLLNLLKEE